MSQHMHTREDSLDYIQNDDNPNDDNTNGCDSECTTDSSYTLTLDGCFSETASFEQRPTVISTQRQQNNCSERGMQTTHVDEDEMKKISPKWRKYSHHINCAFFLAKNYRGVHVNYSDLKKCFSHKETRNGNQEKVLAYICCTECQCKCNVWRCTSCYQILQQRINKHYTDKHMFEEELPWVHEFLDFDFENLVKSQSIPEKCTLFDSNIQKMRRNTTLLLRWKKGKCISCFPHKFPDRSGLVLPPQIFRDFPRQQAKIDFLFLEKLIYLDSSGNKKIAEGVQVAIYTVSPIISYKMSLEFTNQYCTHQEHQGYCIITDAKAVFDLYNFNGKVNQRWILVRTEPTEKEKSHILSLKKLGALEELRRSSTLHDNQISKEFMHLTRQASTPRKQVNWKILKDPRNSTYRGNRLGGSNGTSQGMEMSYIRHRACSKHLVGRCPYKKESMITLPGKKNCSSLWTETNVFYFGVKMNKNKKGEAGDGSNERVAVKSPKNAIPRRAWLTESTQLLDTAEQMFEAMEAQASLKSVSKPVRKTNSAHVSRMKIGAQTTLNIAREVTAITYSAPYLLQRIHLEKDSLSTDVDSWMHCLNVLETAQKEFHGRSLIDNLMSSRALSTVIDAVGGHCDHYFAGSDGKELENKVTFTDGQPSKNLNLNSFVRNGNVPPGALAYPRYATATVCFALSDVELHGLSESGIMHMGVLNDVAQSRPNEENQNNIEEDEQYARGSWTRNERTRRVQYYRRGWAVADHPYVTRSLVAIVDGVPETLPPGPMEDMTHTQVNDRDACSTVSSISAITWDGPSMP